jgi:hypothetical protein
MGAVLRAAGEGQLVLHFLQDRIGISQDVVFPCGFTIAAHGGKIQSLLLAPLLCVGARSIRAVLSWGAALTPLGTQQRPELQSDRRCGVKPADLKQIGGHAVRVGASEAPFCSWPLWKRSANHC